jgi:DNA-binding beta-propeller fold protein YncE
MRLLTLAAALLLAMPSAKAIELTRVKHLFDITSGFNAPSDVAVSKDGRIYVVDGVNNTIKVFNYDGKLRSSFGEEGSANAQFQRPLGIDIASSGKVYIADSGNHRVQIFNAAGQFDAEIKVPANNAKPGDPTDIVADESANRCYVVDNDNHRILVYDLTTFKLIDIFGQPGTGNREFRYPFLIAQDRDKDLYIVDVINTRVQVLNRNGLFVANIGDWGVDKGHFFRPKGVALDKTGRVYVSDSYIGVIQVFDPSGAFLAAVGDIGAKRVKKFKTPVGIFIDHNFRLYVVEMFANRVGVYSIVK